MNDQIVPTTSQTPLWVTESPAMTRLATRCTAWGILAGVGAPLLSAVVGSSPLLWFGSGAGLIVGGLGAATLAVDFLRRRNVRLTWKIGGLLGLPLGVSLVVIGSWSLFVLPTAILEGPSGPSWLLSAAVAVATVLGLVLAVVFGLDFMRFIFRGQREVDDGDAAP